MGLSYFCSAEFIRPLRPFRTREALLERPPGNWNSRRLYLERAKRYWNARRLLRPLYCSLAGDIISVLLAAPGTREAQLEQPQALPGTREALLERPSGQLEQPSVQGKRHPR